MRIVITKKGARSHLAGFRPNGTSLVADLGPGLPYHDLAHFVVERGFALTDGFFGHLARGYSPAQLSDKHVIATLGSAPYRAEVLARALGSLSTGACTPEQFEALVNTELEALGLAPLPLPKDRVDTLRRDYQGLVEHFERLPEGDRLILDLVWLSSTGTVRRMTDPDLAR